MAPVSSFFHILEAMSELDKIISEYLATKSDPFRSSVIDKFPHGTKRFKDQLIKIIEAKVRDKDSEDLEFYLAVAYWDGLDETYKGLLKELILSTWHDAHEDLVSYIDDFKDDAFTDDIFTKRSHLFLSDSMMMKWRQPYANVFML